MAGGTVAERSELRDRTGVFRDREEGGAALAELVAEGGAVPDAVLAIPSGGVPVGIAVARHLALPLDVAVVSKVTLPWNTEAGYGAVAFDGTARLNRDLLPRLGLSREEVEEGVAATRCKVERRVRALRGGTAAPAAAGRTVLLVDDGLASGFTMEVAVEAVRAAGAAGVWVGVPTGHREAVVRIAALAERVFCPNVRGGRSFAVAAAYGRWYDLGEEETRGLLERWREAAAR